MLGAPRSGTTLLYKLLCLHPDAYWISNYQRRLPALPIAGQSVRIARRCTDARQRMWFGVEGDQAYRYKAKRSMAERAFPVPVEGEPFFGKCGVGGDEASTEVDRSEQIVQLRRRVRALMKHAGGSVFVNKRIGHNRRIPLLVDAFPRACFVHIKRDEHSVARSLPKADWWASFTIPWFGGQVTDWVANGGSVADLARRHWAEELTDIETGRSFVAPEQWIEIDFDHLAHSPAGKLQQICQLARMSESTEFLDAVAKVTFASASGGSDAKN